MSDPLELLREYALAQKPIREEEDLVIFGDLAFHKHVQTNFRVYGSSLIHTAYVKEAARRQHQPVTRPDRRELQQYLTNPEAKPPASIDRWNREAEQSSITISKSGNFCDRPFTIDRDCDRPALNSSRPPSDAAIRPLSDTLTADKIKELRSKALTRKRGLLQPTENDPAPKMAKVNPWWLGMDWSPPWRVEKGEPAQS